MADKKEPPSQTKQNKTKQKHLNITYSISHHILSRTNTPTYNTDQPHTPFHNSLHNSLRNTTTHCTTHYATHFKIRYNSSDFKTTKWSIPHLTTHYTTHSNSTHPCTTHLLAIPMFKYHLLVLIECGGKKLVISS